MSDKTNNSSKKKTTKSASISGIDANDYALLVENSINVSGICKNAIKKEADRIRNEA